MSHMGLKCMMSLGMLMRLKKILKQNLSFQKMFPLLYSLNKWLKDLMKNNNQLIFLERKIRRVTISEMFLLEKDQSQQRNQLRMKFKNFMINILLLMENIPTIIILWWAEIHPSWQLNRDSWWRSEVLFQALAQMLADISEIIKDLLPMVLILQWNNIKLCKKESHQEQ